MKHFNFDGYCMHTCRQFAKNAVMLLVALVVGAGIQANAADVTAYTNGSKTEITKSALTNGSLATADSITVTGTWTNTELSTLKQALKSNGNTSTENSILQRVNLSEVLFKGNITNGFEDMFYTCTNLVEVTLPSAEQNNKVSLYKFFYGCSKLKNIINLDKLNNISSLNRTFSNCSNLQSITFSSKANNIGISACRLFENCSNLEDITNMDKFSRIITFEKTFKNCQKLAEIHLGTDPSTLAYENLINTLDSVTCKKYLPWGVSTIPNIWIFLGYNNFILPITLKIDTALKPVEDGKPLTLPILSNMATYCARKDTLWQLASDSTFTDAILYVAGTPVSYAQNGYYLRCGVRAPNLNSKNPNDTTYYSNSIQIKVNEPKVIAAFKNKVLTEYSKDELMARDGILSIYDSIIISGTWNNSALTNLKHALKTGGNLDNKNLNLKSIDLSTVMFDGDITNGADSLFDHFTAVTQIILPKNEQTNKISLRSTFSSCYKLRTIDNLDQLSNITNLRFTFEYSGIRSIKFSDHINTNEISLCGAFFFDLQLKSITNLDKFTNITDLELTFTQCLSLESVAFSNTKNTKCVSMNSTFSSCISLEYIINFEQFTNIHNWEDAFSSCRKLKEVRIGTDIISLDSTRFTDCFKSTNDSCLKYMPTGVTTIPQKWIDANYQNFVLPITISELSTPKVVEDGNALTLLVPTIAETYCARKDTLWQLATDSTFTDAITYAAGTPVTCTQNGYYLRCGVTAPNLNPESTNDTTYFSNSVQITVEAPTATPIVSAGQVRIFSNQETLVIEGLAIGEPYAVYDAAGRCLVNAVSTENEVRLNLPTGIYVVSTAHTTQKVIK